MRYMQMKCKFHANEMSINNMLHYSFVIKRTRFNLFSAIVENRAIAGSTDQDQTAQDVQSDL